MGDLVKLLIGGVAVYFVYEWWIGQQAVATPAATAVTTGTTTGTTTTSAPATVSAPVPAPPPPPPPAYQYVPPTTAQALQSAAGANVATLNADQWNYYYAKLTGKTAIPNTVYMALFFPAGRPAAQSAYPQMTASQFVQAISTQGFSGLGVRGRNYVRSGAPMRRMG